MQIATKKDETYILLLCEKLASLKSYLQLSDELKIYKRCSYNIENGENPSPEDQKNLFYKLINVKENENIDSLIENWRQTTLNKGIERLLKKVNKELRKAHNKIMQEHDEIAFNTLLTTIIRKIKVVNILDILHYQGVAPELTDNMVKDIVATIARRMGPFNCCSEIFNQDTTTTLTGTINTWLEKSSEYTFINGNFQRTSDKTNAIKTEEINTKEEEKPPIILNFR